MFCEDCVWGSGRHCRVASIGSSKTPSSTASSSRKRRHGSSSRSIACPRRAGTRRQGAAQEPRAQPCQGGRAVRSGTERVQAGPDMVRPSTLLLLEPEFRPIQPVIPPASRFRCRRSSSGCSASRVSSCSIHSRAPVRRRSRRSYSAGAGWSPKPTKDTPRFFRSEFSTVVSFATDLAAPRLAMPRPWPQARSTPLSSDR